MAANLDRSGGGNRVIALDAFPFAHDLNIT
jgi:hypothetical protein